MQPHTRAAAQVPICCDLLTRMVAEVWLEDQSFLELPVTYDWASGNRFLNASRAADSYGSVEERCL